MLQRKTDTVDVADDGLFVLIDVICRCGRQLSPADHDTVLILPDSPESIGSKLFQLAGSEIENSRQAGRSEVASDICLGHSGRYRIYDVDFYR